MKYSLILLSAVTLFFIACSSKEPVPEGSDLEDTPEWVQNQGDYQLNFGEDKEGIGAIGSAPKSTLGSQIQREDALLAARSQLASQMRVRVRNVISQTRQRLLEAGMEGTEEIGRLNTENLIMQKVDENIEGSRVIKQWKDPENGELYVWVIIDDKSINRIKAAAVRIQEEEKLDKASNRHKEMIDDAFKENLEALGK